MIIGGLRARDYAGLPAHRTGKTGLVLSLQNLTYTSMVEDTAVNGAVSGSNPDTQADPPSRGHLCGAFLGRISLYKGYFDYYNQSHLTPDYPNGKNIRTCYQIIPIDQVPAQAVLF